MAGIRMENKIYEVGMYCRLSKDDGTDNESASIATQKSILTDYVKKQGWHLAKTYVDDGYSGTNFQRPSFQNMIKDIESGLINCVITKDLSRLGRNYLDFLIFVFWLKSRVQEVGIFLAMGEPKIKIIGQVLLEALMIAVVAISISFAIAPNVSKLTTNYLVDQQVQQAQEEKELNA